MRTLEELLQGEEEVVFHLPPNGEDEVLAELKEMGCKWYNGREIEPKEGRKIFFLAVTKDKTIGILSLICLRFDRNRWIVKEWK